MTQNEICGVCYEHHPREDLVEFGGELVCERCLAAETTACSRCGTRIWNDDNCGNSDTPLCQSCYDDHYTSCSQCGRLILNEDAIYLDDTYDYPLCYNCDSRSRSGDAIRITTTSLRRSSTVTVIGISAWSLRWTKAVKATQVHRPS